jgi:hypothetical protein
MNGRNELAGDIDLTYNTYRLATNPPHRTDNYAKVA